MKETPFRGLILAQRNQGLNQTRSSVIIIHQIKLFSYDFSRNVVPNIMRPTLKHACPSHNMQAVPRGMLKRIIISYLKGPSKPNYSPHRAVVFQGGQLADNKYRETLSAPQECPKSS